MNEYKNSKDSTAETVVGASVFSVVEPDNRVSVELETSADKPETLLKLESTPEGCTLGFSAEETGSTDECIKKFGRVPLADAVQLEWDKEPSHLVGKGSVLVDENGKPILCQRWKFSLPRSDFSLVEFFPDSHYGVIRKNNYYFAIHFSEEFIEPIPFLEYDVLLVTDKCVILQILSLDNEEKKLVLRKDGSTLGDLLIKYSTAFLKGKIERAIQQTTYQVNLGFGPYSLLCSAKSQEVHDSSRGKVEYEYGTYKYDLKRGLIFEDKYGNSILLADENGCYLGFYLIAIGNFSGLVQLGVNLYRNVRRLTQTIVTLTSEDTGKEYLLTCSRPLLVALEDLGLDGSSEVLVVNGVAIIQQEVKGVKCLNVFTPKHQRIILDSQAKLDSLAFGNGIYLPSEGVILLDDGRLLFAKELQEHPDTLVIKNRPISIPQPYLNIE